MSILAVVGVTGFVVFLVRSGNADSIPSITAFQAADMGSRAVIKGMNQLGSSDAISHLDGNCHNGILSGENSSGEYQVSFQSTSGQQMGCSDKLGDVASIETAGIFGSEKRIVRRVVQSASAGPADGSNSYVTTGSESQYKSGALGIGGLLKAYAGISASGARITDVASPISASDVATKAYVDAANTTSGGGSSCTGVVSGGCYVKRNSITGGSIQSTWGRGCKAAYSSAGDCAGAADASHSCGETYSVTESQGSAVYTRSYCLCASL